MVTSRAWAEIDLGTIAHNTREIRRITNKNSKIMVMVKADGYGHGALKVSETVIENGADCVGVACVAEAYELRSNGFSAPIVIIGYTPKADIEKAVALENVALTVSSLEEAVLIDTEAKKQNKTVNLHIKLDTGMTRLGLSCSQESIDAVEEICKLENVFVEGIFSHLARADEDDPEPSIQQFRRFTDFVSALEAKGVFIPVKHICNSAGIIKFPEMHLDMVRPGICIYGASPFDSPVSEIDLKQAMSIKCSVARVMEVPRGTCISYGGIFEAEDNMKVATVLIGYGDGIRRSMSNRGRIIIGGEYANIVGRVCMDMLMADATGISVFPGDEAVIMGGQGNAFISANEIARINDTISYEVFCNMGKRLERVYK